MYKIGAIFIFCATAGHLLNAVEVVAQKSDTFIFEAIPSGEYSKSDFIATAHVKGERALAYIPFIFHAEEYGIQPATDNLTDCKLTLFIKSLPLMPETNALNTDSERILSAKAQKIEDEKTVEERIEEKKEEIVEYAEEKIDAESKTKVVIEILGIIDAETFEPNSNMYRVSWDGQHDAVAPKHNTIDNKLEENGLYHIGKIEFDISTDEYEDGDRYEFTSPELLEYIKFVLGITTAKGETPPFRTQVPKLEYPAIILKQVSGPSGVFFFSADSMGEKVGPQQSGEEVEKKFGRNKDDSKDDADNSETAKKEIAAQSEGAKTSVQDAVNQSAASVKAQLPSGTTSQAEAEKDDAKAAVNQTDAEIAKDINAANQDEKTRKNAPKHKVIYEEEKENSTAVQSSKAGLVQSAKTNSEKGKSAKGKPDIKYKSLELNEDEVEIVREVKPDRRPRIDFEFRRVFETSEESSN